MHAHPWQIAGAAGEAVIGDAHLPGGEGPARGVVLIVHGLMGYKDYGMFPHLAARFAREGFVALRFNLSHSGVTRACERFERPDLFERDTWNRQVADIDAVIAAMAKGDVPGGGLPVALLGHSRGGVSCLLCAGRRFKRNAATPPSAVVTLAAPDACCTLTPEAEARMRQRGFMELVSARTGQTLRVGRAWLDEQRADPAAHDLARHIAAIRCPILVAHGAADPTVPPSAAERIVAAAPAGLATHLPIDGGDHVLNTPNPTPPDAAPSAQLARFTVAAIAFLSRSFAVSGAR